MDTLIPKLPNVIQYEYTHGTNEKGADFVICKNDPTLNDNEFVGVIAKIDKIKQNFTALETQIDECNLPRLFNNGKNKIYLNEIWIITTKTISSNAKEKIHEKYKNRSIKFISGSKLIELINAHFPTFWVNIPIQVNKYLNQLQIANAEQDTNMSLLQVSDKRFYIEHDIYKSIPITEQSKQKRKNESIVIYDEINKNKILFIEGEMGAGKTKLILHLIDYYSTPENYNKYKFIPLKISFSEIYDKFDSNIDNFLEDINLKLSEYGIQNEKLLIFIDGFDEKNLKYEDQQKALEDLINQIDTTKCIKFIITSRPLHGITEIENLNKKISRYEIRALSLNKTIKFIKLLCKELNIKDRIFEDIRKSELLKVLPKNPIAAILLAKLISENSDELPSNMTELYSKYIELVLGRWDIDKGLQSQKEYEVLDNIMMQLAEFMIDNETNIISIGDVEHIFLNYLKERNLDIRFEELFENLIKRCDIVNIDNVMGTFQFKHKTFTEFLYARQHAKYNKELQIDNRIFNTYWSNIYFFYIGILKDCPDIINKITKLSPKSEGEKWFKIINMSNFLLAAYTTPYKVIETSIKNIMIDSARLYTDIISGKKESFFLNFPQILLLAFIRIIIRDSYSYEFFKQALEDNAIDISDNNKIEDNLKLYALLFLDMAYIEISGEESFEFLFKQDLEKLPLDIRLAITTEAEHFSKKNAILKKQEKYFRRVLRKNPSFKSKVDAMFEKPLKDIKKLK